MQIIRPKLWRLSMHWNIRCFTTLYQHYSSNETLMVNINVYWREKSWPILRNCKLNSVLEDMGITMKTCEETDIWTGTTPDINTLGLMGNANKSSVSWEKWCRRPVPIFIEIHSLVSERKLVDGRSCFLQSSFIWCSLLCGQREHKSRTLGYEF
jgi:hypothetical protein